MQKNKTQNHKLHVGNFGKTFFCKEMRQLVLLICW